MNDLFPSLRIVIQQEQGHYVAQCLELDIAVHAKTMEDLQRAISYKLHAHCILAKRRGEEPFDNISPAPQRFFTLWLKASQCSPRSTMPIHSDEISREATLCMV